MQVRMKTVLRTLALVAATIVLVGVGLAAYVYATLPKPIGEKPALQAELFTRPSQLLPVDERFLYASATDLAAMIRERRATSTEVVQAHINVIKNRNHATKAFVWLFEREALEAAREADAKVARGEPLGLLHGVPVSIKEEFAVKGKPHTVNSTMFQGVVAERDAGVVEAWVAEGAIVVGTTNVPYLLLDMQTAGEIYPTATNPYDPARTPGGSTGGGAAAVAAGLAPLALGGDMGGSIRVPAAFCGLYGLKTTEGSMGGDASSFPGAPGTARYRRMAVAGPLARTVDDVDLAWRALMSRWPEGRARMIEPKATLDQYRVAYLDEWKFGSDRMFVGHEIKDRLASLMTSLRSRGVATSEDQPANFDAMVEMHRLLSVYMAFEHVPWFIRQLMMREFRSADTRRFDYSEAYARMSDLDPAQYDGILARRDALATQLDEFFTRHDVLMMPVTAGPAIAHNEDHHPIPLDGRAITYWDYFSYPMVFNVTGHPALTIPLGLGDTGLPLAMQVVGPQYSERQLLAFAKLIEPLHDGFVRPPEHATSGSAQAR